MFTEVIPSHLVASWLLHNIDRLLDFVGLSHEKEIEEILYVAIIVAAALFVGWLLRCIILFASRKFLAIKDTELGRQLLDHHILTRCSHIIPPLVILGLLPFAFTSDSKLLHLFTNAVIIYFLIVTGMAINAVLKFIWMRFDSKANKQNLPLKGILDVAIGVVWIIVAIIGGSVLLGKSPANLLAGLGVFATALMLVFKDSILGFVAGIQLSQNDMLRVGDWIVVPSTIANGICIDVTLTTVKVQNWDNTIVTLPPYSLISSSFQNWRGMSDSGYRLISRSVYVDTDSVQPATPELIQSISSLPGMEQFIDKVKKDGPFYDPALACVNGSTATNLGLLRAYMCAYLLAHPLIGKDQQILVRIMTPEPSGMPLQIYCYTTTAWTAYEAVQSEIFEHLASVAPKFGIRIFNAPSGLDLKDGLDKVAETASASAPVAVQASSNPSAGTPSPA
ncbi:MAG: mechanosensitive ion channel family protein [Muribaculaceae bacterium]|nr:mechanosensitive ion channel family protein [Muribaculaceae bacterium]